MYRAIRMPNRKKLGSGALSSRTHDWAVTMRTYLPEI